MGLHLVYSMIFFIQSLHHVCLLPKEAYLISFMLILLLGFDRAFLQRTITKFSRLMQMPIVFCLMLAFDGNANSSFFIIPWRLAQKKGTYVFPFQKEDSTTEKKAEKS